MNYEQGNGIWRVMQFEQDGRRNIVIGGQGEAEVNVKWSFDEAFKSLCNVAEQCGYMVHKDTQSWFEWHIHVYNHGHYVLVYHNQAKYGVTPNMKLMQIKRIIERISWSHDTTEAETVKDYMELATR